MHFFAGQILFGPYNTGPAFGPGINGVRKRKHTMRMKYLLSAAFVASVAATSVYAADNAAPTNKGDNAAAARRQLMKQKIEESWSKADKDGDGAISKAEFLAQAEERFSKLDLNKDDKVTKEERKEFVQQRVQANAAKKAAAAPQKTN